MSKKSHFPKYNLYFEKIQESFWILFLFFELGLKSVPSSSLYSYFSRTVHDYSKNRKKIKLCYKNHIFRNFHFSVEVTILWETTRNSTQMLMYLMRTYLVPTSKVWTKMNHLNLPKKRPSEQIVHTTFTQNQDRVLNCDYKLHCVSVLYHISLTSKIFSNHQKIS